MRKQHRLGGLQMSLARHDRIRMCPGLIRQCLHDVEHALGDASGRVAQPHPKQCGHLIVSGSAGTETAADVRAHPFDQPAFEGTVYVLVGIGWDEHARRDIPTQLL
ncbi:Uncharacterised protein [Mycobacteroides abscessus subsp. abscessus]|nr:Uncharacterised protein [Mycobacteroides abscessus subsp. abscessus]SKL65533.1 Uncharacterised protein [Mycobacteroides abscessus subsp. abscessus]SLJ02475.1 Uncharacterised protein [Mycobacteroides abscessus subsp. abscessus]